MIRENQSTSQSVRRLVLVADDEPALHQIVARVLATFDLVALLADDGAMAIAAVKARQSELCGAIMAIAMPGVDGLPPRLSSSPCQTWRLSS